MVAKAVPVAIPKPYEKNRIHRITERFLSKWYPEGVKLPVDVPLIAEKAGLDIVPMPSYVFQRIGLAGVLVYYKKADQFSICVDKTLLDPARNNESFYRFTVAEEVGHFLLHANAFRSLSSVTQFIDWYDSIGQDNYTRIEIEAKLAAADLLIPYSLLWELVKSWQSSRECNPASFPVFEEYLSAAVESLGKRFEVSRECMRKRFFQTGVERHLRDAYIQFH